MNQNELLKLIAAAQAGDRAAQEQLVMAVQNKVYYHCKKFLKNDEDAQDATQDVLIAMLTNLEKLQEAAAFWGWLNRITANRCKHILTQGPREWQIPEDEEGNSALDSMETLDDQAIPDQALDNDETRRLVLDIIDSLPAEQRMTVVFFYYDEMSVKDIARMMEVSEGTVKSRLNYARKSIKLEVEKLEKEGTKLYSVSILPFLAYFLRRGAEMQTLSPAAGAAVTQGTLAAVGTGAAASAAAAGTASAGAAGTAAPMAAAPAVTYAAPAAAAGAKAAGAVSVKAVAAVLAGVLAAGGIGAAVYLSSRPEPEPAAEPPAAETFEFMPWLNPEDTAEPEPEDIPEPEEPPRPYADAYINKVLEQSGQLGDDARYNLVSINDDDIPELMVCWHESNDLLDPRYGSPCIYNLYSATPSGDLYPVAEEIYTDDSTDFFYFPSHNVIGTETLIFPMRGTIVANYYRMDENGQMEKFFSSESEDLQQPDAPQETEGLTSEYLNCTMTAEEILALLGYDAERIEPAETLDFDFSDYAGSYTADPRMAVSHSGDLIDLTLNSDGSLSGGGEIPSWSSTPIGIPTCTAPIELRVGSSGHGGDGTYTFILQSRRIETGAGMITAEEYYVLYPAGTADPTGGDSSTIRLYYENVDGGAWNMLYTKN